MNEDSYKRVEIRPTDFKRLSTFIQANYGIKMPPEKKLLVEGRLQKRLRANEMQSFGAYCELLFSKDGRTEIEYMIDAISTNTTNFFREAGHFDYLSDHIIPEFEQDGLRHLNVWSAAASSGEEIYTIAISLEEYRRTRETKLDYTILGTDVSNEILERATHAVYHEDRIATIPMDLKKRYFLRSKDRTKRLVKVAPGLRSKSKFQQLNLMDLSYNVPNNFDIIFCRNVLIYFEREIQEKVITKLCEHVRPGGYILLGHSESIIKRKFPLRIIKPTIYQRL